MNLPEIEQITGHKCTFILGAGFSKDFFPEKIPLANDFLHIAETNGFLENSERNNYKDLIQFTEYYFGDYKKVNIETLASFLTLPMLPDRKIKNENRNKLYSDLLEIIVRTVENVHQCPKDEDTKNTYSDFAKTLTKIRANVISFNYDLILDEMLRMTGDWSPQFGYGIPFRTVEDPLTEIPRSVFTRYSRDVQCYKLHGSVNWGKPRIQPLYGDKSVYINRHSVDNIAPLLSINRSNSDLTPIKYTVS